MLVYTEMVCHLCYITINQCLLKIWEDNDVVAIVPCSLCQDMREYEVGGPSRGAAGASHFDELGKRRTIKPDSYFSDEDASD